MRARTLLATAAAITCITGLAACTSTTDGIGVAASSGAPGSTSPSSSAAAVNTAQLDTGTYPTSPSAPFGFATAPDPEIVGAEGQRLAEFVTIPSEIDPEMTEIGLPTGVVFGTGSLKSVFASQAIADAAGVKGLVTGFFTSAGQPKKKISDKTRSLTQLVLRYNSPAAANAAAIAMNRASITTPAPGGDTFAPTTIRDLPGTLVSRASGRSPEMRSFTAHNSYVISTGVVVPPGQENAMESIIRTAVAQQVPLIDRFPATPIVPGVKSRIKLDQNNILIYAIPETEGQMLGGLTRGVYGPRGMSSLYGPSVFKALQDNGSEHNAVWHSTVSRASTDDGADAIEKKLVDADVANGYTRSDSPKGLPTATCLTEDTATGQENNCYVTVGRYVGSTYDRDMSKARQMISAQYLILTKADQTAN
ncbi:DUF7373 family lipoprotein [Williamsia maris]|uniref:Uncharacterized protein n=1 Tax=Williamsia maris TaxID=72806 RepID=A0ABT1HBU3_9NOCA|nr:hypothetical protein [Williamsia maris]MCP2175151.1 hypothetical protein [Williamsia maris]